jgi:hypothetical protein
MEGLGWWMSLGPCDLVWGWLLIKKQTEFLIFIYKEKIVFCCAGTVLRTIADQHGECCLKFERGE